MQPSGQRSQRATRSGPSDAGQALISLLQKCRIGACRRQDLLLGPDRRFPHEGSANSARLASQEPKPPGGLHSVIFKYVHVFSEIAQKRGLCGVLVAQGRTLCSSVSAMRVLSSMCAYVIRGGRDPIVASRAPRPPRVCRDGDQRTFMEQWSCRRELSVVGPKSWRSLASKFAESSGRDRLDARRH